MQVNPDHKLVPAPVARREYFGGISAMCEWRWRESGLLPQPIKINGRCYYREADLIAVQDRHAAQSGAA